MITADPMVEWSVPATTNPSKDLPQLPHTRPDPAEHMCVTIKNALTVARLNAVIRSTTSEPERTAAEYQLARIVARTRVAKALSATLLGTYGLGVTMPAGRLDVTV